MSAVIDHVSLAVRDLTAGTVFYEQALSALGFELVYRETEYVTFGLNDNGDFAIHQANKRVGGAHIAFPASNREHVERFWGAALAAGATPVRAPGTHPDYGRGSFAAFVRDRDGNNIEAVYRAPI